MKKLSIVFNAFIVFLFVVMLVAGCSSGASGGERIGDSYVYYTHDVSHHVGIWQSSSGHIFVIPDSQYGR